MNPSIHFVTGVGSTDQWNLACGTISIFVVEKGQEAQQKNILYLLFQVM
jgi:hypothetical protein